GTTGSRQTRWHPWNPVCGPKSPTRPPRFRSPSSRKPGPTSNGPAPPAMSCSASPTCPTTSRPAPSAGQSPGWTPTTSRRRSTHSRWPRPFSGCWRKCSRISVLRLGKDLGAGVGDEDGVLELGGPTLVLGGDGPAVGPDVVRDGAERDHRLDGEGHAGLDE